jgi:hypothetical protein
MKKYVYIGIAVLAMIAIVVMLISIAEDLYYTIRPSGLPTSIYASHVTAIKFFVIAALCLVVGIIMRLLKV